MTRDMKSTKRPPAKKKSGGGTLIGMFIGLVLGVCLAAGVVWYINKAPLPFNTQANERPVATQPEQPLALPGKPGDPVPEKRFQFYDILQGKADAEPDKVPPPVSVPETVAVETPAPASTPDTREARVPLFLQAGSFSTAADADNQKAKLAFMGIQSAVQQVMIEDRTLYRVRIGPYYKIDDLNKVRSDLAKSGIEAQLSR